MKDALITYVKNLTRYYLCNSLLVYITSMKFIVLPFRVDCNTKTKYSNLKLCGLIFTTTVSFELFTNSPKHII